MADQFVVSEFTTPASSGGTFDVTHPDISGTCQAAVFFFSAETTDDSQHAHALTGMSFMAEDGVASDEITIGMGVRSIDAVTSTHLTTTAKFIGPGTQGVIATPADSNTTTFQVVATLNSFITGGVRCNSVTATSQTKGSALLIAGVSRVYAGSFVATTAGGSEAVGGSGGEFEPDLIIFSVTSGTYSGGGTFNRNGILSTSFAVNDGTDKQVGACIGWNSSVDPADGKGAVYTDTVAGMSSAAAITFETVHITFTSTGFDHISSAGSPDGSYLAIKFADPDTRVGCFNFLAAASTGEQSFSCGFQPRFVMTQSSLMTSLDTETDGATSTSGGRSMFDGTVQRAYSVSSKEGFTVTAGAPTIAKSRQGAHALLTLDDDGAVSQQADWVSFGGSGFTLDFTTAVDSGYFIALAIGEEVPPSVLNETVEISEGLVMFGSRTVVFDETMEIAETCDSITNFVLTDRFTAGWTLTGGSKRGSTLTPGAEMGSLL